MFLDGCLEYNEYKYYIFLATVVVTHESLFTDVFKRYKRDILLHLREKILNKTIRESNKIFHSSGKNKGHTSLNCMC